MLPPRASQMARWRSRQNRKLFLSRPLNHPMQNRVWPEAIKRCADPQRARRYLDQLEATEAAPVLKAASGEQARILAALFSGSQALSEMLIARPDWLATTLNAESLRHPR